EDGKRILGARRRIGEHAEAHGRREDEGEQPEPGGQALAKSRRDPGAGHEPDRRAHGDGDGVQDRPGQGAEDHRRMVWLDVRPNRHGLEGGAAGHYSSGVTESLEDAPEPASRYDTMAEGYARYWAPVIRPAAVRVLDSVVHILDGRDEAR